MNRFIRSAIACVLAWAAVAALAPKAEAVPAIQGRFNGFVESNQLPAVQRGTAIFDVLTQQGGMFTGNIVNMIPPVCNFHVQGSVGPTGGISGNGIGDDGNNIIFIGRTITEGDGSVRVLSLRYRETAPNGKIVDTGYFVMVQMQGGPDWAIPGNPVVPVSGHWDGRYNFGDGQGGGIFMDLFQMPAGSNNQQGVLFAGPIFSSSFKGTGGMTNVVIPGSNGFFDVFFDIQGTVGSPMQMDGPPTAPFGAITLQNQPLPNGKTGIIAILIGLLLPAVQSPPMIQGQYHLFSSFSDVFQEVYGGQSMAFQRGAFGMIPLPPSI